MLLYARNVIISEIHANDLKQCQRRVDRHLRLVRCPASELSYLILGVIKHTAVIRHTRQRKTNAFSFISVTLEAAASKNLCFIEIMGWDLCFLPPAFITISWAVLLIRFAEISYALQASLFTLAL